MPSFRSGQQVAEIEMASVLLGVSKRKLIDHLDQAVLAKAFQSELLPQDPKDESASVLERIRAERATGSSKKALTANRAGRSS